MNNKSNTKNYRRVTSVGVLLHRLVRLRLRLAAWIAGGEAHQFEGRKHDGSWVKGEVILTPRGMEAMRAAFRHDASVFVDTSLRDLPHA